MIEKQIIHVIKFADPRVLAREAEKAARAAAEAREQAAQLRRAARRPQVVVTFLGPRGTK